MNFTIQAFLLPSALPLDPAAASRVADSCCPTDKPTVEAKIEGVAAPILDPPILDPDAPPLNSHTISQALLDEPTELEDERVKFGDEFNKFIETCKSRQAFFARIEASFSNFLKFFEYVDCNQPNNLGLLKQTVSDENYAPTEATILRVNRLLKWVDDSFHFVFNVSKFFNTMLLRDQYGVHLDHFETLSPSTDKSSNPLSGPSSSDQTTSTATTLRQRVDKWGLDLNREHAYLQSMIKLKGAKLLSKFSTPFGYFNLDDREASKAGRSAFGMFRGAWGISTIRKLLAIQKAWSAHLSPPHQVKITDVEEEAQEDDEFVSLPAPQQGGYDDIGKFIAGLQQCTTIQQVNQMLELDLANTPSIYDDPLVMSLQKKGMSFEQVKIRIENYLLQRDVRAFLMSLIKCSTLKEVKKILDDKSIITIELPQAFNRWRTQLKDPQFKSMLKESYYVATGKRPWTLRSYKDSVTDSIVDGDIEKRLAAAQKEREKKIERAASTIIAKNIDACQTKSYPEIVEHFKSLHVHFDTLVLDKTLQQALPWPLTSKDEWQACAASPEFCQALAAQWVDYQEALSQLTDQTGRQFLLSTLSVENKFLNFHWTKYNVGILSSAVQFIFCLEYLSLQIATSVLKIFVTEFASMNIPGAGLLYLGYPLYPNFSFKPEAIIMLLAEHFFGIKHRPNEYSLESYQLSMQIRLVELQEVARYLLTTIQGILLWINIRLIENRVMELEQKPLEADNRYQGLTDQYRKACMDCQNTIISYKARLNALKLADVNIALNPEIADLRTNDKPFDPIENFVHSLQDADFDYFTPAALSSFKTNFGFELTNDVKPHLKRKITDFLLRKEKKLTEHFLENRSTSAA